jgi:hypothetical protein
MSLKEGVRVRANLQYTDTPVRLYGPSDGVRPDRITQLLQSLLTLSAASRWCLAGP